MNFRRVYGNMPMISRGVFLKATVEGGAPEGTAREKLGPSMA
jgi:hypothetical protein